ncbi:endonuclease/exonuclease/phosphatase family protein [Marinivivus vitaminiproducens]|uniref:endonuclease/exonuclease/phosphatase family protein n=1 Tax=Marinivivus vitaminiproducens TaxID=3035935 RepID=UPI0027A47576|nr:endonuclease/exonuclease/phosphatase family protein [Geminicoccaceae bacterium SCSIO 64248]
MTPFACRVATYNIHACRGRDQRFDLPRIVDVLAELDADVVALQEVESRADYSAIDQFEALEEACGLHALPGAVVAGGCGGSYGNMILSRFPAHVVGRIDLAQPGREPRGALEAEIRPENRSSFRFVATHLGLLAAERRAQFAALADGLDDRAAPVIIAGDLNEWLPFRRHLRDWRRRFAAGRGQPSFPSGTPLFALDRIFGLGEVAIRRQFVHGSALARIASDHRPVVADLKLRLAEDIVAAPQRVLAVSRF